MKECFLYTALLLSGCSYLEGEEAPKPDVKVHGQRLDYSYETLCWDTKCSNEKKPKLKAPVVTAKAGAAIEVSLQHFKAKPSHMCLTNMTTGEKLYMATSKLLRLEPKQQQARYELELVWEDIKGRRIGHSIMQLAVQTK